MESSHTDTVTDSSPKLLSTMVAYGNIFEFKSFLLELFFLFVFVFTFRGNKRNRAHEILTAQKFIHVTFNIGCFSRNAY